MSNALSLSLNEGEVHIVFVGQKKMIGRTEKSKIMREP
jgi:hypothetical protein